MATDGIVSFLESPLLALFITLLLGAFALSGRFSQHLAQIFLFCSVVVGGLAVYRSGIKDIRLSGGCILFLIALGLFASYFISPKTVIPEQPQVADSKPKVTAPAAPSTADTAPPTETRPSKMTVPREKSLPAPVNALSPESLSKMENLELKFQSELFAAKLRKSAKEWDDSYGAINAKWAEDQALHPDETDYNYKKRVADQESNHVSLEKNSHRNTFLTHGRFVTSLFSVSAE